MEIKIKEIIDSKIKNLEPSLEENLIKEILELNLKSQNKIVKFIRNKLELPRVGSDKKIYWEKRGWKKEEIEDKRLIKTMKSSPMIIDNWTKKINPKTGKFYSLEEARYKVNSFRKTNKEFWIEKGFSKEESVEMVAKFQKENSIKFIDKFSKNKDKYPRNTQILFWINKGYSEEESLLKIKKRQDTTSYKKHVQKYGEKADEIYNERIKQISYINSRKFYIHKYGIDEGNKLYDLRSKNKYVKLCRASKESYLFFKDIYKFLRKNEIKKEDIYWGVGSSKEWYSSTKEGLFFYDFTVPKLNLVIEYNGIKFHPNENDETIDRNKWKCLYSNIGFEEKLKYDNLKKDVMIKKGYQYISVFSNEDLNKKIIEIKEIIKDKLI